MNTKCDVMLSAEDEVDFLTSINVYFSPVKRRRSTYHDERGSDTYLEQKKANVHIRSTNT
jgi:hypothetical protein